MDQIEARRSTRRRIVEAIRTITVKRGEPLFPVEYLNSNEDIAEVWQTFVTVREGLRPSEVFLLYFDSYAKVLEFQNNHPIGSDFDSRTGDEELDCRIIRTYMEPGFPFGVVAGDRESPLAFEILSDAGVYRERFGSLSDEVVIYLGLERISELTERYAENWQVAAAFEFCWMNLPHSSPAFIAASYQYHHYISEDDFSAGYHWRDLEITAHRVEEEALKAIETRKKAGASGSKRSALARETRRSALMDAIEDVARRNPDISKLGEEALAELALAQASQSNPALWRQGKGQIMEYVGEIRRGEAGDTAKARYLAIFGPKAPKRF